MARVPLGPYFKILPADDQVNSLVDVRELISKNFEKSLSSFLVICEGIKTQLKCDKKQKQKKKKKKKKKQLKFHSKLSKTLCKIILLYGFAEEWL